MGFRRGLLGRAGKRKWEKGRYLRWNSITERISITGRAGQGSWGESFFSKGNFLLEMDKRESLSALTRIGESREIRMGK
jgi:hypothetical protein